MSLNIDKRLNHTENEIEKLDKKYREILEILNEQNEIKVKFSNKFHNLSIY